ncbi:MAG: BMP family lipoprotein [Streptosporangiaceae bacterium]
MRRTHRLLAGLALVGLAVAGCGSPPASGGNQGQEGGGGGGGGASASSFKACMVTDTGGIDDRSFNASAWKGLKQAKQANPNLKIQYLQSQSESDYVPNINAFINQDCGLIVTVGFLMGDATKNAAKQHKDQDFAIVDFKFDPPLDNVKGLVYNTAPAGMLGGYLAAGLTKTGTVATYGGQKIPGVTPYMDGFWDGVHYYNKKHGTDVKLLGWNRKTQNGTFVGSFTDKAKGKQVTETFMQQGADIIFPVAGNVGLGTTAAVKQQGKGKVHVIWVDQPGCVSDPQECELFVASVTKGIVASVKQVSTKAAASGNFEGGNYLGLLKNDGVDLVYGKKYESKIPSKLKSEIKQLRKDIISGKVEAKTKGVA